MNTPVNQFIRNDGFVDKPVDCSNPICEKWIHVEAVEKTGEGDDEFVIVHKPKCIERFDINKRIHEEAKGTDLKSLIKQVLRTGDATLLNQRSGGSYVDISGYPSNTMDAMNNLVRGNDLLGELPDDLKSKKLEDLINMSAEDIGNYVKEQINAAVEASKPKEENNSPASSAEVTKEGE